MKQNITQKKQRFLTVKKSTLAAKFQKLRSRLGLLIPMGYEDETGFHTGDSGETFSG